MAVISLENRHAHYSICEKRFPKAVIFYAKRFIKAIGPFVVPVLTGTCGFVTASISPKSL